MRSYPDKENPIGSVVSKIIWYKQTDRQTNRQADRQTDKLIDKQTDKLTDQQTDRHRVTLLF